MSSVTLPADIPETVARALAEDIGTGDVTAALIAPGALAKAEVRARERAILCGAAWFDEVFRRIDPRIAVQWRCTDGAEVSADSVVCSLQGPARGILTGERTALNFLQTLSGTATTARRYADAVAGTQARVLDTRKTLPGLRSAQKYAVRCGGASNHRQGLFDAVLIKENHIAAAGGIAAAVRHARQDAGPLMIEIEVETLDELHQALATDADRVLLDNFTLEDMRGAVAIRDEAAGAGKRPGLEASGNVSLETLRAIAETGIDFISVGALTKHLQATDYSMRFI
ncbi:MAG TPA: carboxylating nicotinate-nucleotide diphosphorylase [Gammaproteobacteria bacterium]|nr:carboxylating nicotinate-nucleotide diphosphorylase [Gammaproteobacteria bacterium]